MLTADKYNFKDKKVLVRVDFNVPLDKAQHITDDNRLRACIPTISKILKDGGSAILMSHLGRPKNGPEQKYSLVHVLQWLKDNYKTNVYFANDCIGAEATKMAGSLKPGEILLLENLRFYKEEENGNEDFAKELANYGDVWVNDAFGTAHRAHASTSIIAKFFKDRVCGFVMKAELENANLILNNAKKPFTAIMGGAKVSDKILIIEKLLDKVDNLIIGGGMTYTFVLAEGGKIGKSISEPEKIELAKTIISKAKEKGVNLYFPVDNLIADDFNNNANKKTVAKGEIPDGWEGLDIGPETIRIFQEVVEKSKTILWNGPMGVFEFPNFANGTNAIAQSVVKATQNGGYSLIGGGDSASAIINAGFGDQVSYVSTGGGALLEYIEGKVLPGVAALEN